MAEAFWGHESPEQFIQGTHQRLIPAVIAEADPAKLVTTKLTGGTKSPGQALWGPRLGRICEFVTTGADPLMMEGRHPSHQIICLEPSLDATAGIVGRVIANSESMTQSLP